MEHYYLAIFFANNLCGLCSLFQTTIPSYWFFLGFILQFLVSVYGHLDEFLPKFSLESAPLVAVIETVNV